MELTNNRESLVKGCVEKGERGQEESELLL